MNIPKIKIGYWLKIEDDISDTICVVSQYDIDKCCLISISPRTRFTFIVEDTITDVVFEREKREKREKDYPVNNGLYLSQDTVKGLLRGMSLDTTITILTVEITAKNSQYQFDPMLRWVGEDCKGRLN